MEPKPILLDARCDALTQTSTWSLARDGARWRHWSIQGGWAVLDQALFAGSNFAVSVLLARWLSPTDYGAFITSYAALLLVAVVHAGLLTEPLLVFGSGRYSPGFAKYLSVVVVEHVWLTGLALVVLAATGTVVWMLGDARLAAAITGMACAIPAILLLWLARRAYYAQSKPASAAAASTVYFALTIGGLYVLHVMNALSVLGGQLLMAAAALLASVRTLNSLTWDSGTRTVDEQRSHIWSEHWGYGKWSIGTGALQWVHFHGWAVFIVPLAGLEASAALRATLNLVLPILQFNIAISGLLVPAFIRARASPESLRQLVLVTGLLAVGQSVLYGLAILVWGGVAMELLYAGAYAADRRILIILAAMPLAFGLGIVFGAAVMALEQPKKLFRASAAGAIVAVPVGWAAIEVWGVAGALAAIAAGSAIQAALNGWFLRDQHGAGQRRLTSESSTR